MTIPEDRDPISLFEEWYDGAQDSGIGEPSAVALATADAKGRASVRMVLLKDVDHRGFVFYTNLESRKGIQLASALSRDMPISRPTNAPSTAPAAVATSWPLPLPI